jgi:CheY-like chemotaxis protein
MPEGGQITIRTTNVTLDAQTVRTHADAQPGDYVVLSVADTGCGMDERTRARIFEPFFTTKPSGKGTGMGLSTVVGIVKDAGGFITVESEMGQGSTFSVHFPRAHAALAPMQSEHALLPQPGGTETILVVDDDEIVRALILRILERRGYKVLQASGGEEAIQLVNDAKTTIDLLLTDVVMPGMKGPEVSLQIRKVSPSTKVLFTSAYADATATSGDGPSLPFQILSKPFTSLSLTTKVREALDEMRSRVE